MAIDPTRDIASAVVFPGAEWGAQPGDDRPVAQMPDSTRRGSNEWGLVSVGEGGSRLRVFGSDGASLEFPDGNGAVSPSGDLTRHGSPGAPIIDTRPLQEPKPVQPKRAGFSAEL